MKLDPKYLIHSTGGETLLVPTGDADFAGVVRGNRTLGAILELLKDGTTETELVAALRSRFDAPEGAVERDVARALSELRRIGAIEE